MKSYHLQFIFILSLVFSLFLTPLFARLAQRLGIVDHPAHRKTHQEPVAYLGGVATFTAFILAFALTFLLFRSVGKAFTYHGFAKAFLIIGASLGVAAVGLVDDIKILPARYKLMGQAVFALAFTFFGFQFQVLHLPGFHAISLGLLSVPVTVFWILAIVNAFNMIDGLDGLAATVAAGSLVLLAAAAAIVGNGMQLIMSLGALGAVLGFLPFNWRPAKIYMGDAGSGGLGMFIACALVALGQSYGETISPNPALAQPFHYQILTVTFLVAYPALEIILSVSRRTFRGSPIWRADKGHIHHRLHNAGWSAPNICFLALGMTLLPGITALTTLAKYHGWAALVLLLYGLLIGLGLSTLGFLDFIGPRLMEHLRPHYRIAHHFISMQKEKLYLASSREEILALINQTCQELGIRSLRLVIAQDSAGLGGLDYSNSWDLDKPAEYLGFIHDSTQGDSKTFSDHYKLPGGQGGAHWVFEPHTEEEELDVEYHVLVSEFMGWALNRAKTLGVGQPSLDVNRITPIAHKKVSGQALRLKQKAEKKESSKKETGNKTQPQPPAGWTVPAGSARDHYENLLWLAVGAALKAGKAVREVYETDFKVEYKGENDPLTLADKKAHHIINGILSQDADHSFPVLSEEGRNIPYQERKDWEYFWMVDPLDGTKEFLKKNGEFTVNITLIHVNRPVLGVVYVPVSKTLYAAAEGLGAFKAENIISPQGTLGQLLSFSKKLTAKDAPSAGGTLKVVASRSHMSPETKDYVALLGKKFDIELVSAGSSLKLCLVAEGKAHLYPRFAPTMEWDTAAGQAIVENAGGIVADSETQTPLRYNKENLLNPWFIAGRKEMAAPSSPKLRIRVKKS